MAEPWIKIGTEILRNPKVGEAGPDGLLIFVELLASCIRSDRDGVVPASFSDVKHLQGMLFLWRLTPKRIRISLEKLQTVGLIEQLPTGGFLISGWDDYWKPPYTSAERKTREREKKRRDLGLEPMEPDGTPPKSHGEGVTPSRGGRDKCHDPCHDPKVGKKGGKKERRKTARDVTPPPPDPEAADPVDPVDGVTRSFRARAISEAERLASRESHPLGVQGFANARIAIEWHAKLKAGTVRASVVPLCYLDYLKDPETGKLLEVPLDPAHDAGKLAAIAAGNRRSDRLQNPLFSQTPDLKKEPA